MELDISPWWLLLGAFFTIICVWGYANYLEWSTMKQQMSSDTVLAQMTDEELDEWIDHR